MMTVRVPRIRVVLWALLLLTATGGAAQAAVAFDVAVGLNVNDDARIFLNVTNQTWHPAVAPTFIQECAYPEDDFPVIAFLAYHTHRPPSFILGLRNDGYRWGDIFFQLNVNPSVLFVGIDRDPGPPYGKAWGYWRQRYHPGARMRYRFSDRDIVGLVKVQTASRHFGSSPYTFIKSEREGRRVEVFAADRWREKHGRRTWAEGPGSRRVSGRDQRAPQHDHGSSEDSGSRGRGKEKDQGHGKGHGKGHGNGGER